MKKQLRFRRVFLLLLVICEVAALAICFLLKRRGSLPMGGSALTRLLLIFLLADGTALLAFRNHRLRNDPAYQGRRRIYMAVLLIALLSSIPLFTDYIVEGHDLEFHLLRIEGIKDGLLSGQFPVRIHVNTFSGYGYGTPLFYPELLLYGPALLRLSGVPIMTAYKLFVFAVNLATAALSYACFSRMFRSKKAGLCGSFVYTLSLYRLVNVYARAAVGEYTAMLFLPLVLYGLYRILSEEPQRLSLRTDWMPLCAGMTGLAATHLLSCEMVLPFLVVACLIFLGRTFQKKRLLLILFAAGATVLTLACFLVPMLDTLRFDSYQVFSWSLYDRTADAANLAQLFPLLPSGSGESLPLEAGIPGEMSLGVGFGFLIILALYLALWARRRALAAQFAGEGGELHTRSAGVCAMFFLSLVALWMSTNLFPWRQIYLGGGILASLCNTLQFPWRMLSIASLLLSGVFAHCVTLLPGKGSVTPYRFAAVAAACTVAFTGIAFSDRLLQQTPAYHAYTYADIDPTRGIGDGEYLPTCCTLKPQAGDQPAVSGGTLVESASGPLRYWLEVEAGDTGMTIDLPLTCYPGYQAVDQNGGPISLGESPDGRLRVLLPGGFTGEVSVGYHEKPLWRATDALSLATVLCAGALLLDERKKRKARG